MDTIFKTIKEYLGLHKTNYAIQLNGPWGIGKTYYVTEILKPEIEKLPVPDSDKKYKFIYISLNGIKSVDEIDEILFLNSIDGVLNVGYRSAKWGLRIASKISPLGVGQGVEGELSNVAKKFTNLKNTVLCFDDLERIDKSLSIQHILGYINSNYVEHENIKTIFISNQEKLEEENYFYKIKEKIIGRTIQYNKVIDEVLPDFIYNNYQESEKIRDFYEENSQIILQIIKFMSEGVNLRTLRFIFDSFLQVINNCELVERNNRIRLSVFINILLISEDFKNGLVNEPKELELLYDLSTLGFLNFSSKEETKQEKYAKTFRDKYLQNSMISELFKMHKSIGIYILTGHLNAELLEEEIKEIYLKQENKEQKALRVIYLYSEFELDELQSNIEIVIEGIEKGSYKPEIYLEVYRSLFHFKSENIIQLDLEQLQEKFNIGLQKSFELHGVEVEDYRLERNFYYAIEDQYYTELVHKIKEKKIEKIREKDHFLIEEFMCSIKEVDMDKFRMHYSQIKDKDSFFASVDQERLCNEIFDFPNKGIGMFSTFIKEKYLYISNANKFYKHEVEFIENLILSLRSKIEEVFIDSLKRSIVLELIGCLEKVKEHISK
ncbi:P-loop NTPase fold protein [Bacillus thuringiensis]|uniref:Uncharacterized protein n=1 Tax=Bacillus thuringiensis DB27 TaxID=1431339 RepID=W8Y4N4_BACTU|nr:P-loop NTPase fold protein [Bacillus thuringiensis]MBG9630907.1 hypothetical protein [Bacillus thuringiensis]MBG9668278.1 hypothetical protein [Bacillus thuringiensis]MBH0352588.1 hypothetical protein [Bacillus thuringiensis]CDN36419.1 unnamed protein product [Bacillus thuringiensis DB27]